MVQREIGGRPRGIRVDTELSEVPDSGLEDAEPVVRTGEIAPRDVDESLSTFTAGWLSSDGQQPVWYYAMDGDPATFIQNAGGGAGVLLMTLKGPRLIARIIMSGLFNNVGVEVWNLQTQAWVSVLNLLADATVRDGIDTDNFTPVSTNRIRVTFAVAATSERIVDTHILTVQEIKGNIVANVNVDDTPEEPLFVQEQGMVVNEEVTITSDLPGVVTNILDHNPATFIGPGLGVTTITFQSPLLVGRVGVQGTLVAADVDVMQMDGTYLGVGVGISTTSGWDSGNFTGGPILARAVRITCAGPGNSTIFEVSILKVKEVKANVTAEVFVEAPPEDPIHVQAQQVIVAEEVDVPASIIVGGVGTVDSLFDHNSATGVAFPGLGPEGVIITLNSPILIARTTARFWLAGVRQDAIIIVTDVEGNQHIVYDGSSVSPELVLGLDSQNFKDQPSLPGGGAVASPIMAMSISILTAGIGPAWDISELSILKAVETKAFAYNEPSEPLFVEDDQHICLDEVWWPYLVTQNVTSGNPRDPFSKSLGKFVTLGVNGILNYPFNTPHLVSRVALTGAGTDVSIQLQSPDGTIKVLATEVDFSPGWDSGNFKPFLASSITITTALVTGDLNLSDLTILKAKETKSFVYDTPDEPLFVQDRHIVTVDEVDLNSGTGPFTPTTIPLVLDLDDSTGVVMSDVGSFQLKTPIKCSELLIVWTPSPVMVPLEVTLFDTNGVQIVQIIDLPLSDVPQEAHVEFGVSAVKRIQVTAGDPGAVISTIQLTKVSETKAMVHSGIGAPITSTTEGSGKEALDVHLAGSDLIPTPAAPTFVQAEQQLVLGEFSSIVGSAGVLTPLAIMDKSVLTFATLPAGARTVTSTLTHPILISRVLVTGLLDDISVTVVTPEGVPMVVVAEGDGDALDSLNFEPVYASVIIIGQAVTSLGSQVTELIVQKVIETKAAQNLNPLATGNYFDAVVINGGQRRMADGAAYTDPTDLGGPGTFVEVGKDQNNTTTALCEVDADPAVVTYSLLLDWYFSDDSVRWHFGGSSLLSDTTIAGNVSGFEAAGETAWRALAKPVNQYGRYIALVLRHTSGAGTNQVTVTIRIIRQR